MQAVIMAGGKGTRLASVTQNIPKPMVPIAGKPLLEYQIGSLKENGIQNIILVVGYLGDVIRQHFGDGRAFGVHITYFVEKTPLGTAGALAELKDRLEEQFVLLFGDLFINVNFERFCQFHETHSAAITLFAHPNSHPFDSDIIVTDDENRVIGWNHKKSERTTDYKNLVNAGLYVIDKAVVNKIENVQQKKNAEHVENPCNVDLEKEIIAPLISSALIFAYNSTEYVKDIGTPDRLSKVTTDFLNGVCEQRNLKHKQKCIFLDRDGTINKYVGFLRTVNLVELEESASEAIRMINDSEYLAIVITNQPVIARGECSFGELDRIHNRIYTLLGRKGAYLDGLYFCPHHPDSGFTGEIKELKQDCICRKPKVGMLKQAEIQFNADLEHSWFVGDTSQDVQTGLNAGMRTILLRSGDPIKNRYNVKPEFQADNLLDAVRIILSNKTET